MPPESNWELLRVLLGLCVEAWKSSGNDWVIVGCALGEGFGLRYRESLGKPTGPPYQLPLVGHAARADWTNSRDEGAITVAGLKTSSDHQHVDIYAGEGKRTV